MHLESFEQYCFGEQIFLTQFFQIQYLIFSDKNHEDHKGAGKSRSGKDRMEPTLSLKMRGREWVMDEMTEDQQRTKKNAAQQSVVRSVCKQWVHLYFLGHNFFFKNSLISRIPFLK